MPRAIGIRRRKKVLNAEDEFWIQLSYRYCLPVAKLKFSITSKHFRELYDYELANPYWPIRLEYGLARIAQLIYNSNIDTKTTKPATLEDMLLKFDRKNEQEEMTVEETEAMFKALFGV